MSVGAVVVAAGMSSRMGDFKPLLNLGSISIARRVIAALQQGGVEKIVVVTGYRGDELEHHLYKCGVIFLRNENYETTDMFYSASKGLSYLKDKCERVLFTPVDIPLFSPETVGALLSCGAPLAYPACEGKTGHPILLCREVIAKVLDDSGKGGLKCALERCGIPPTLVEVNDVGILQDADTPQDFAELLRFHNQMLIRPVIEVSLARQQTFFNNKAAMLLSLVEETHSVRLACKQMRISYSSGWNLLNAMEEELGLALVRRSQGGAKGGCSTLTEQGRLLLDAYTVYTNDLKKAAEELFRHHFKEYFP